MIYDMNETFELPQLSGERITSIAVINQALIFAFDRITAKNQLVFECDRFVITFWGFDDINADIEFYVYEIKQDSSMIGKNYYVDEFISWFEKQNMSIEIVDIMSERKKVQINGHLLLNGQYVKQICATVFAEKMIYGNAHRVSRHGNNS